MEEFRIAEEQLDEAKRKFRQGKVGLVALRAVMSKYYRAMKKRDQEFIAKHGSDSSEKPWSGVTDYIKGL